MQQKIVITGGPGTGKSTILNELIQRNFTCMPEISREIILEAKAKGVEQLFLKDPLLFSETLLQKREKQFLEAKNSKSKLIFFDRGIPDIHAYMNYLGVDYPDTYLQKSVEHRYTTAFILPPWKDIYITDNERYENYKQAIAIYNHLIKTYNSLKYSIIEVPIGSIDERVDFILNCIK